MKEYTIDITSADYLPGYDPSACGNGGGYWQPYGDCTICLEDGAILRAEYDDTSCGDYGARWNMTISHKAEAWSLHVDEIGTDAEMQADYAAHNTAALDALASRFGIDSSAMIGRIKRAVNDAAQDKYWKEEEEK